MLVEQIALSLVALTLYGKIATKNSPIPFSSTAWEMVGLQLRVNVRT
jgi:hypothetical protein